MYWFIVDRWAQKSKLSQKYLLSFTIASNVFEKKLYFLSHFRFGEKRLKVKATMLYGPHFRAGF